MKITFDPENYPLVESITNCITGEDSAVAKSALLFVLASIICLQSPTPEDAAKLAEDAANTIRNAVPEMWGDFRAMGPGGVIPTAGNA